MKYANTYDIFSGWLYHYRMTGWMNQPWCLYLFVVETSICGNRCVLMAPWIKWTESMTWDRWHIHKIRGIDNWVLIVWFWICCWDYDDFMDTRVEYFDIWTIQRPRSSVLWFNDYDCDINNGVNLENMPGYSRVMF